MARRIPGEWVPFDVNTARNSSPALMRKPVRPNCASSRTMGNASPSRPGCRWYTLSLSISSAANVTPSPEHRNAVRRAVPCAQRHTTPMASARFMDA